MSGESVAPYEFYAKQLVLYLQKWFKLLLKTIVIDFMKMKNEEEREQIIKKMKQLGKRDFARVSVEDFTKLGLLEMTREKLFPSVNQTLTAVINYDTISSVDAQ